jgi:hypothetical protein
MHQTKTADTTETTDETTNTTRSTSDTNIKDNMDQIDNVRYIRVQRISPSPKNENIINIARIKVLHNNTSIPLVNGVIVTPFAERQFGWEALKNTSDSMSDFASSSNIMGATITVDMGSARTIDEITVWNRVLYGVDRINGCELQVLDGNQAVIRRWAFSNVDDVKAKAEGAHYYTVNKASQFKLVAGWKTP